jgi:hypothetical protein
MAHIKYDPINPQSSTHPGVHAHDMLPDRPMLPVGDVPRPQHSSREENKRARTQVEEGPEVHTISHSAFCSALSITNSIVILVFFLRYLSCFCFCF